MMSDIHFAVQGLGEGSGKLLEMWQVEPSTGMAFSTDDADERERLTWSITLPADLGLAQHLIGRQVGLIGHQQHQLGLAEKNLRNLDLIAPAEMAFTVTDARAAEESPEMTLRRNLAQIQSTEAGVALGLGDWLPSWERTVADYEAQLGQILGLLKPTMRIETKVETKRIALTILHWPGQLQTANSPGLTTSQFQLHQQSLTLVLQSRLTLLQLLGKTGSGAAMLAAKLSLPFPVGPLLAMPAAWRYLQDLRQQTDAFNQLNVSSEVSIPR